ncbi:MAG TPA: hypothetical protein VGD40_00410 [Chryseosolibacter sp.]
MFYRSTYNQMMTSTMPVQLIERKRLRHAVVFAVQDSPETTVVQATSNYIPIEQFKEIFNFIGELVEHEKVKRLVFDKRNLTVFHQPSMEWYFVEWKEKMYAHGLTVHRKILPADQVFRQSVKIGREKINKAYPNGKFHQMDIAYAETLEDAITR